MSDMRDIRENLEGGETKDVLTFPIGELYTHTGQCSELGKIEIENFIDAIADISIAIAKRKGDGSN